jgi:hypothetical protein
MYDGLEWAITKAYFQGMKDERARAIEMIERTKDADGTLDDAIDRIEDND